MAVESCTLGKYFVLDVLQTTGAVEEINIAGSQIVGAGISGFKVKGVQVDVLTAQAGAKVDVHKGTSSAANRLCSQVDAGSVGSVLTAMAPIDGRTVANLSFARSDTLNIHVSAAAARVRVRIYIGQGTENTIATTS